MSSGFYCKFLTPERSIADFVENIGMFHNDSDEEREIVIIPDGRVDLFFIKSGEGPFQVILIGLETKPEERTIPAQTLAFVVSFKPVAVEYILHTSIAGILDRAMNLPENYWDMKDEDLKDLDAFYTKANEKVRELIPKDIDERKRELFRLVYSSKGEMPVKEISEKVFWSSRQINRYFNQQFGLSLKEFCTILRFRASLEHIAKGRLFPELNFADQTHFIKEIKKFSGVAPKELAKNKDDRFILLSVLRQQ